MVACPSDHTPGPSGSVSKSQDRDGERSSSSNDRINPRRTSAGILFRNLGPTIEGKGW